MLSLLDLVIAPGWVSPGPKWSNPDYFLHFFESWTSRDRHRIRRLRWRKFWMPFVDYEVVERDDVTSVYVRSRTRGRLVIGCAIAAIAMTIGVVVPFVGNLESFPVATTIACIIGLVVATSPSAEVKGVARVLVRLLVRHSIDDPASVQRLLTSRITIP